MDPANALGEALPERGGDPGGGLRRLAGRLLEKEIVRLDRAALAAERRLAGDLRLVVAGRLHRPLGHLRLRGYLEERLGLGLLEARALVRLDRMLAARPAFARALDAGSLTRLQLEAILPVAAPGSEDLWLERAARLGTRELLERAGRPLRAAPAGATGAVRPARPAPDTDIWLEATEAVRVALRPGGARGDAGGFIAALAEERPTARRATGTLGASPAAFDPPNAEPLLPPFQSSRGDLDPAGLDLRLARTSRARQALDAGIGRMLVVLHRHGLHRALGEESFDAWARLALGLGPAAAAASLAFHAALARHDAVFEAYRRGRLSRIQAALVLRLAGPRDERMWVRWAERTTVARLRCAAATRSGPRPALPSGAGRPQTGPGPGAARPAARSGRAG